MTILSRFAVLLNFRLLAASGLTKDNVRLKLIVKMRGYGSSLRSNCYTSQLALNNGSAESL